MNSHLEQSLCSPRSRGRTLAVGFGTTTAMWAVCYLSLINPGPVIGEILFALILLCLLAGGWIVGRSLQPGENAVLASIKPALVTAVLNLLIVGALLFDNEHHLKPHAGLWIAGNFAAPLVLMIIGAVIGSSSGAAHAKSINWYNRFIIVAAATVFLLLITGGLVTGKEAGLAVPDWPTSFGHNMLLYPLSEMSGGKYFEHAHRLYGMLVGVTAMTVAVSMFWFDRRGWLRALAVAYLFMVIGQGVLGGAGRVLQREVWYAIVHGVFGQVVFATIVSIAAFTSDTWLRSPAPSVKPSAPTDRKMATLLPILLIIQLALGALYRHLRRQMDNPPQPMHVLYTHIFVAIMVTLLIIYIGGRAWGIHREHAVLPAIGRTLLVLLGGQLMLGLASLIAVWSRSPNGEIPAIEVIVTTAHQATGALMLATATLLMVWIRRLLAAPQAEAPISH